MNSITGPTLLPFALHRVCPACGEDSSPRQRWRQRFFGSTDPHATQQLCYGGKEPTEDGHVATIMGSVPVQRHWNCAGIGEPHLHVTCRNCGHQVFTRTMQPLISGSRL